MRQPLATCVPPPWSWGASRVSAAGGAGWRGAECWSKCVQLCRSRHLWRTRCRAAVAGELWMPQHPWCALHATSSLECATPPSPQRCLCLRMRTLRKRWSGPCLASSGLWARWVVGWVGWGRSAGGGKLDARSLSSAANVCPSCRERHCTKRTVRPPSLPLCDRSAPPPRACWCTSASPPPSLPASRSGPSQSRCHYFWLLLVAEPGRAVPPTAFLSLSGMPTCLDQPPGSLLVYPFPACPATCRLYPARWATRWSQTAAWGPWCQRRSMRRCGCLWGCSCANLASPDFCGAPSNLATPSLCP